MTQFAYFLNIYEFKKDLLQVLVQQKVKYNTEIIPTFQVVTWTDKPW